MSTEIPPWLREQLTRLEQTQQNFQAVLAQKQQIEAELAEVEKALTELKNAKDSDTVYKSSGPILVKKTKAAVVKDLEEKKELANARAVVLAKQEKRMKAAHMRYVKEVSKILTEKQFEEWKKVRDDHRQEHHSGRQSLKPQNRPALRRPKGK